LRSGRSSFNGVRHQGQDGFFYPGVAGRQPNTKVTSTGFGGPVGSGPFVHQDVRDPPTSTAAPATLHIGGQYQSYLLQLVIPVGVETSQT
jgi:hypothetical protein